MKIDSGYANSARIAISFLATLSIGDCLGKVQVVFSSEIHESFVAKEENFSGSTYGE